MKLDGLCLARKSRLVCRSLTPRGGKLYELSCQRHLAMIDVADFSMQQTLQLQKRHKTSNELAASARNTNTNLIFLKNRNKQDREKLRVLWHLRFRKNGLRLIPCSVSVWKVSTRRQFAIQSDQKSKRNSNSCFSWDFFKTYDYSPPHCSPTTQRTNETVNLSGNL